MIASFKGAETRKLFDTGKSRRIPSTIHRVTLRKLNALQFAINLNDLRIPAGNHLEALKGVREGQHSIRINDQYRLCFVWKQDQAYDVEIVDYH